MSLFKLTEQYNQVREMLLDGEIDPQTAADTLEAIEGAKEAKIDNIVTWIKQIESDIDQIDQYVKDKQVQKSAMKNTISRLKDNLIVSLGNAGQKRYTTEHYRLSIRNNHKVQINDSTQLPDKYWKQKDPEVNKKAIADDIKNGVKVPGAEYVLSPSITMKWGVANGTTSINC